MISRIVMEWNKDIESEQFICVLILNIEVLTQSEILQAISASCMVENINYINNIK
ncbi:hypothetical protein CWI39_0005p0020 [Hamiltosporidium magnivora]|uniref:Uncharacterized protein n=1 Tax=Hamiltosporidium magnivora TaxID=148818 RepID=A0A4Q9LRE3_9MICR|nr:hypothetical protein CWI39_0005p0020 [Hamiltosporidium magnivora]